MKPVKCRHHECKAQRAHELAEVGRVEEAVAIWRRGERVRCRK